MATYLELQERVQRRVIDLPTAITTEVPTLVNRAVKKLQEQHNFQVMQAKADFTTVVSTRELGAVPSNFKEYRVTDGPPAYLTQFSGTILPVFVVPKTAALYTYPGDEEGTPVYLAEQEPLDEDLTRDWEIYPMSDGGSDYGDGEYRITVPYWKFLTELSADSDSNWLTNNADDWIVYEATGNAFMLDWDEQHAAGFKAMAKQEWQDILRRDKMAVLSKLVSIMPHQGVRDIFHPV